MPHDPCTCIDLFTCIQTYIFTLGFMPFLLGFVALHLYMCHCLGAHDNVLDGDRDVSSSSCATCFLGPFLEVMRWL
jgi:hypothetical protein